MTCDAPFWETTPLNAMTPEQWESLCDGCGLCCLHKIEDEESGELFYTDVACRLFDGEACRCKHYEERAQRVPDCLILSPDALYILKWMPTSCAYRRVHEGRRLAPWHPLVSGDPEAVHRAGISARGRTVPEEAIHPDDLEFRIVSWLVCNDDTHHNES